MNLSPASLEVLQKIRAGLVARGALLELSREDLQVVHKAEDDLDAEEYAGWAGRRMAWVMNLQPRDIRAARSWYAMLLRDGYLVKKDYVQLAVKAAEKWARRYLHGEKE